MIPATPSAWQEQMWLRCRTVEDAQPETTGNQRI